MIRKLLSILLAVMMVFAAGCSAAESSAAVGDIPTTAAAELPPVITAEALYEQMLSALSAASPTSGSGSADVRLAMDIGLFSLDAGISAAGDVTLSHEPFGLHAAGNLTTILPGLDLSRSVQVYAGEEDVYCHLTSANLWLRFDCSELTEEPEFAFTPVDLTVERQMSGYVLRGGLSIEKPEVLAGTVLRGECHVDRDTFLPTDIKLKSEQIPDGIQYYVNLILDRAGLDQSARMTAFEISLKELGYEPLDVPAVPQLGIDASREISSLTGADILKILKK